MAKDILTKKELEVINKKITGEKLTQQDSNYLSRYIRPKLKKISQIEAKKLLNLISYNQKKNSIENIAIVRIEQLYPFDNAQLQIILSKYQNLKQVVWVQEEPQNMGAWNFLALKLMNLLPDNVKLFYVGRKESAATATGLLRIHLEEQNGLVKQAFEDMV